jgi:hypothetical protein
VVVVINETLAKRFFPGESPLGRSVTVEWGNPTTTGRVIGVVGDVRSMGLDTEPEPTTYWSTTQLGRSLGQVGIAVRLAPGATGVREAMLREVRAEDADLPLSEVKMMEVHLAESVARRRLTTTLVSAFGGRRAAARGGGAVRRDRVHGGAAHARDRPARGARRARG